MFLTVFLIAMAIIITLTLILRITGNTPSIAGYMIFRVSSGSMQPELNVGDVILSKEISDIYELKIGDVVSYKSASGETEGKIITHKVVKTAYNNGGVDYIVTRGVANLEDDAPVSSDRIVGVMQFKIPLLNELYSFFLTPWGLVAVILLILLAFSGEFWNIYKLSHKEDEELPEVSDDDIQRAIEDYKKEKQGTSVELDLPENVLRELKLAEQEENSDPEPPSDEENPELEPPSDEENPELEPPSDEESPTPEPPSDED